MGSGETGVPVCMEAGSLYRQFPGIVTDLRSWREEKPRRSVIPDTAFSGTHRISLHLSCCTSVFTPVGHRLHLFLGSGFLPAPHCCVQFSSAVRFRRASRTACISGRTV